VSLEVDEELIERIAQRVVEMLDAERGSMRFVDASAVARELGVERDWVYEHARELGAIRLGSPRGRLRFDMQIVKERLGEAQPLPGGARGPISKRRKSPMRRRRPKQASPPTPERGSKQRRIEHPRRDRGR
jgi:hypothetical protein